MRALLALAFAILVSAGFTIPADAAMPFPVRIDLPSGFRPEGIEVGRGDTFYVGSIPTGDIRQGSLRTGETALLVDAPAGRAATGIEFDNRNRLFVAGGGTGDGYVYDADTGAELAVYDFASSATFINDVCRNADRCLVHRLDEGSALPGPDRSGRDAGHAD
jgi:hypothetical protein